MIQEDTIKLLRECDAGVKMGVSSIDEVLERIEQRPFYQRMETCKNEHEHLDGEIQALLEEYEDDGRPPSPMAKSMSWMKTHMKLAADASDETIADLMTDGCHMGVKSLYKYLNRYQAADERSKELAKRLISSEERLISDIRCYL